MTYHNTTQEAAEQVEIFAVKNKDQNATVLRIATALKIFSPSQIFNRYPVANVPITSIRRAIHTLFKERKIEKNTYEDGSFKKTLGMYGRNEFQYRIVE